MKKVILVIILFSSISGNAQDKIYCKTGVVTFFSKAPIENIEARNNKLLSIYNILTGQMEFSILMKGFEFDKALMQQHFNENYVESDKYPKSTFAGKIIDPQKIILGTDGVYNVSISGTLTLHGVTKPLQVPATFTINNSKITAVSAFTIRLSDYKIKIPALVRQNISNVVTINVSVPSFQSL